jgi:hypothetical protein
MKANDLRWGNLVNYTIEKSTFQGKITAITKNRLGVDKVNYKFINVEAIPITEEWLIKLGFKKRNERLFTLNYFEIHMVNKLLYFESYKLIPLYFIHQLQNIYFISEGVELELSSNVA